MAYMPPSNDIAPNKSQVPVSSIKISLGRRSLPSVQCFSFLPPHFYQHQASRTMAPGLALNQYSGQITVPRSQGNSQAMLYATGIKDEAQMQLPQIGISSVWYEGNPCTLPSCTSVTQAICTFWIWPKKSRRVSKEPKRLTPSFSTQLGFRMVFLWARME